MYSLIFSSCILSLFALLIFWNCKRQSDRNLSRESYLQNLNNLRGLFALEIVIGHVIRYEQTILYPMEKFMICSVAFFFFVSAFGMTVSYEKKENYLNHNFILSKPIYLLILTILIFVLNAGIDAICPNDLLFCTPPPYILHAYLTKTNWYLWSQILFYLLFFFSYKYLYRFRISFICIITILRTIVMYLTGFPEGWWASSYAFPLGLIVGEHFASVKKFLFSKKGILTVIFLSLFGLSCLLVPEENIVSFVFMRNSICLAFLLILLYVCTFFVLGNHPVARYLNKYSTEIYLTQFIWLQLSESYGFNYMIRMPIVLIATLISAMILHPIVVFIKKRLLSLFT